MKNTGFWNDGKEGIILTNKKLIWKNGWSEPKFIAFYAISEYRKLPQLATDEENTYFYQLAQKIGKNYSNL
ncbi:MAG: hypothetical protein ACKO9I_09070 [Sphaerospermopsis kisseleviana]